MFILFAHYLGPSRLRETPTTGIGEFSFLNGSTFPEALRPPRSDDEPQLGLTGRTEMGFLAPP
jgi:hypothetical protein